MTAEQRKAVVLISGGLDSMLAAKLMIEQGIHVEGLNFYTGFCHSGHTSAIRKQGDKVKRNDALWVAEQLGIKLHIIDAVQEYKDVLTKPQYGYGQNMNPCLDCKIFMVRKAREWMEDHGFDFIVTGEVVGQRPKSQRKETMKIVAKNTVTEDVLLRPLSAKNLVPTKPETEGWVDREALMDFSGRNRKPQIALAEKYQFDEYAQPSGGCCVLTDESYTRKLADMWQTQGDKEYELDDIILLKVGRHLRPKKSFKLIIGREEGENNFLEGYRKQYTHLRILNFSGPLTLIEGETNAEDLHLAARICSRYSAGRNAEQVQVQIEQLNGVSQVINVEPMNGDDIPQEWHV